MKRPESSTRTYPEIPPTDRSFAATTSSRVSACGSTNSFFRQWTRTPDSARTARTSGTLPAFRLTNVTTGGEALTTNIRCRR